MSKLQIINPQKLFFGLALCLLTLLSSCNAAKTKGQTGSAKSNSISALIKLHNSKNFKFSTLQSRLKISYKDGEKAFNPSASLRIEKDKKIWLSVKILGITMAKAYITPDRVSFYEKLNNNYYDGDFKALSGFLGTDVDFKKVQNLLLGQSILELKNQKYDTNTNIENQVLIVPNKQDPLYEVLLGLYVSNYKVSQLQIVQQEDESSIKVNYPTYQKIEDQDFPNKVSIFAKSNLENKQITIDYKSVEINKPLSFPYKIPDGYKAFQLN